MIRAAPDAVWRQIMDARDIKPDEMKHAVDLPHRRRHCRSAGVVEQTPSGPVTEDNGWARMCISTRSSRDWQENRYVQVDLSPLSGLVSARTPSTITSWSAATTSTSRTRHMLLRLTDEGTELRRSAWGTA